MSTNNIRFFYGDSWKSISKLSQLHTLSVSLIIIGVNAEEEGKGENVAKGDTNKGKGTFLLLYRLVLLCLNQLAFRNVHSVPSGYGTE